MTTRISFLWLQSQNNNGQESRQDNDSEEDQVEFDEWGGIITDKVILRQIKEEKNRIIKKEQRRKKKAKKHAKKMKTKRKHDKEERDHEDGELSTSDSSDSELDNANEMQKKKIKQDVDDEELLSSVPIFEKSNRFHGIYNNFNLFQKLYIENLFMFSFILFFYSHSKKISAILAHNST